MRFLGCCLIFLLILQPLGLVHGQSNTLIGVTNDVANFRTGPELTYPIIRTLTAGVTIILDGRNTSGLWLHGSVDGQAGWVFFSLVDIAGDLSTLPVMTPPATTEAQPPNTAGLVSQTIGSVNFRTGPGTNYSVIRLLGPNTLVTFNGRNSNNTWYRGVVNGQEGWLYYALVSIAGDVNELPVVATAPTTSTTTTETVRPPSGIVTIGSRSREIFRAGQALGNRANVFAKVGDSISYSPYFLHPIANGGLRLDSYTYLQPVVDYFSQVGTRTHNSFGNASVATGGGWTSADLLNPARSVPGVCQPGETPLVCEYRILKPALALIMVGTNDVAYFDGGTYQANLQTIVQTSIDMGVIPVLSTIPDNLASSAYGTQALYFNSIIRGVAAAYGVPLWDYWAALQPLPNKGLSADGIHPSINPTILESGIFTASELQYGYNMRNLTALIVLDTLWKQVLSG